MKKITYLLSRGLMALLAAHLIGTAQASSHQDAPLIIRDPSANTTDVYAFVQNENGTKSLVTALGVYPQRGDKAFCPVFILHERVNVRGVGGRIANYKGSVLVTG